MVVAAGLEPATSCPLFRQKPLRVAGLIWPY